MSGGPAPASVRRGSLPEQLVALLPPLLRDAYDLDELVAADVNGQLVWAVLQGLSLGYGEVVAFAFEESILSTWSVLYPADVLA